MKATTLTPAYGRDYPNAGAASAAFEQGKDFLIADVSNPWDRKPANLSQLREAGYTQVNIRYLGARRLTTVFIDKV